MRSTKAAFRPSACRAFAPLANSAELAAIYSVARQESEFAGAAASGAGAKGLMQILPSTARDTARRMGVPFDPARLTADLAYNTQLGAAYLGQLLDDEGGSYVLALAAYNAGGGRVQQWIDAYGDPRAGRRRSRRLGRAHSLRRNARLCAARLREPAVYRARLGDPAKAPVEPQTGRVARADF